MLVSTVLPTRCTSSISCTVNKLQKEKKNMFSDHPVEIASANMKPSLETDASLFESAKKYGKKGVRSVKNLANSSYKSFWIDIPNDIVSKFTKTFETDTTKHLNHVEDIKDKINAEINTLKKQKAELRKAEMEFKREPAESSKKNSLEKKLTKKQNIVSKTKGELEKLINSDSVKDVGKMFSSTVYFGTATAGDELKRIQDSVDKLRTTTLGQLEASRKKAQDASVNSINELVTSARSLL